MRPDFSACLSCRMTLTQCTQCFEQSSTWQLHLSVPHDISTIPSHHLTEDRRTRTWGCLLLAGAVCIPCLAYPFLTVLCLLNWGFTTWPQQTYMAETFLYSAVFLILKCSVEWYEVGCLLVFYYCRISPKIAQASDSPSITQDYFLSFLSDL